jgi:TM2 domain-containing membrane protein YozV
MESRIMAIAHKNKTVAALLAFLFGSVGIHRFYLCGWKDTGAWLHFFTLPITVALLRIEAAQPLITVLNPFVISILASFIETLVIGLTPDDKWDLQYNQNSGRQSDSNWPIALLMVLTLGIGATALIAAIARTFDLLFTGGAYG